MVRSDYWLLVMHIWLVGAVLSPTTLAFAACSVYVLIAAGVATMHRIKEIK